MLLFTVFNGFTATFNGLILRRDLGASPLQLSILGSANAACLLGSLVLTRLIDSRRPLPWVVWPNLIARGLFLLVPLITSPWPFIAVRVAGNLLGTLASPAQVAVVQQVYPRAERGRALSAVRVAAPPSRSRLRWSPGASWAGSPIGGCSSAPASSAWRRACASAACLSPPR
jgi:MFS family permease